MADQHTKSHIIAVVNQKGGVGKTTTAINVASYLARLGRQVLLIDLDPQGNATGGLGFNKAKSAPTTYDVFTGTAGFGNTAKASEEPNLWLSPANANLAAAEHELIQQPQREHVLAKALGGLSYDYIIIDCPPSLGLLSINALTAAHQVLIPLQAEYYALEGLSQLLNVLQGIQRTIRPDLDLLGIVLTMYDSRTALADQVQQEVRKHFGDKVLKTVVPRNVRLAEAPSFGKSIFEHDKWSKGARAYKQLAKEIDKRVRG